MQLNFAHCKDDILNMWRLFRGAEFPSATVPAQFQQQEGANHPFAEHYRQYVLPQVQEFEQKRLECVEQLRPRVKIAFPLYALFVILNLVGSLALIQELGGALVNSVILLCFVTVGGYWWLSAPIREYSGQVKGKVYPLIFSYFGEEFIYRAEGQLPIMALKASRIIPGYDRETSEDYVAGQYKGVRIVLQETHLERKRRRKNRTEWDTVFRGVIVELEANKPFTGHTVIRRDFGRIGNFFAAKFGSSDMEPVKLEDPEFEDKFEVYSTDQIEARYLLTTSFMERLLELARLFTDPETVKLYKGIPEYANKLSAQLQASFFHNKLLLMIGSKHNRFEIASVFEPCTFEYEVNTILEEMNQLFAIIDVLKLDQQTHL